MLSSTTLRLAHADAIRQGKPKEAERIRRRLLEEHGVGHRWLSDTVLIWEYQKPKRRKKP